LQTQGSPNLIYKEKPGAINGRKRRNQNGDSNIFNGAQEKTNKAERASPNLSSDQK